MNLRSSMAGMLCLVMASVGVGCATHQGELMTYATPPAREAPTTPETPRADVHRAMWRTFLMQQRAAQIERLKAYSAAGQFAMDDNPGLHFVWRDGQGRLCAMANLVAQSGRMDLVDRVATNHNDLQLASVRDGDLLEWMLRSGLTQEEVQLIQFPDFNGGRAPIGLQPSEPQPDPRMVWEITRKRAHLASVVERLEMDSVDSIELALDRLEDRIDVDPLSA
jgi:hypothetical protein